MREVRKQKGRFLKRLVSIVAVMVLCITGIDLSAFGVVSAEGNSGYKLEVEYSADSTSAVIKGKTDTVGQNIGLLQVTDGNGQVYDANNFEYPVTENREYSFTLTYNETVGGNSTEKQESLKAQVSNIVTIEPESETAETATDTSGAVQLNEVAEETQDETAATAATEAEAAAETESTEATTVTEVESAANEIEAQAEAVGGETEAATVDGFPETLPLETLKANAANLMAGRSSVSAFSNETGSLTKTVTAVTEENQIKLDLGGGNSQFQFPGGVFSADTVPVVNEQRKFYRALYIDGNGAQYEINGIYPYSNDTGIEWYYTLKEVQQGGTVSGNGTESAGDISLGFLMDSANGQIWAEYALDESAPSYPINISGTGVVNISRDNTGFWKVNAPETAKHTEKVVFEFDVPVAYQNAKVKILDSKGATVKSFDTAAGDSLTIVDAERRRYSGIFDMPSGGATIQFAAVEYTTGPTRYYGFGVDKSDIQTVKDRAGGLSSVSADVSWKRLVNGAASTNGKDATLEWEGVNYGGTQHGSSAPTYRNGQITVSETAKNKPYYNLDGSSESLKVAWGEFNISDDVVLQVSYGIYQRAYTDSWKTAWTKVPVVLRIDTYPNSVNNDEVVSEVIDLPKATGKKNAVTKRLSCGAEVIVECTKYNGGGTFSSKNNYVKPAVNCTESSNSYFTYKITVSNMPYAFKTYLNSDSNAQKPIMFNIDEESIIVGSGTCDSASTTASAGAMAEFVTNNGGLKGSFWSGGNKNADGEIDKRYAYSLTDSLGIWAKYSISPDLTTRDTGYFELYIKVKEGYGQPKVTPSSGRAEFIGVKSGYFFFTYQTSNEKPIYIDISAEPITFDFAYRDGLGNTIGEADTGHVPATASEYVLKTVDLDSPRDANGKQEYFHGWRVEYRVNDTDDTNEVLDTTMYYSGQIVSLKDIYSKMLEKGWIVDKTNYTIFIVGQWGDRNTNSQVPAQYKISYQNAAKGLTITAGNKPTDIPGLEGIYKNYIETQVTTTVNAYYDQTARLAGYKSQFQAEGKNTKYLLSPDSIFTGDIKEDNQVFAHLIYMYAVSVEFDADVSKYGSGGDFSSQQGIQAINERLANTYYIPAKNYNSNNRKLWAFELFEQGTGQTNPLNGYNPGAKGNRAFLGWKVKTTGNQTWIVDGNNKKWLNIYDLASEMPDLWAEVVQAGKIVLEPVWEEDIGKITAYNSEGLVQTTPESHSVTTGNNYSISNTFSYTGKWDADGFSYALRKDNRDGTYDVWYSYFDRTEGAKKNGVTAEVSNDDKAKTVTVTINIPADLVSKTNLQDQTLSLSAWNSANGVQDKKMTTSGLGLAAKVNNVFTTSPRAITLVSQATEVSTLERKGYEISSTFTYDSLYYTEADIRATVSGLSYAVYYKTKDGTAEKKWWKEDGTDAGTAGSGPGVTYLTPTVDPTKEQITLKFWVGNIEDYYKGEADRKNSGSVDMKHDNSHYYIACWNTTNGDYTIDQALEQIKLGSTSKVPYADVTTRVTWRDPEFYVSIPATIMLEDGDGKSADYAGKKVSISFSSDTSSDASAENGEYRVPNMTVAVQGEITLTSADSSETRKVLVCGSDGVEIPPSDGNYNIGTLAYNKRSIVAWFNTPKGNKRGEKWTGTATFTLTNTSRYPETSTVSENTDVAINTDL